MKTFLAIPGAILLLTAALCVPAHASSWYLMAADEKDVAEPQAAIRMAHGSVAGPFRTTSRGEFASREECEASRNKLAAEWTGRSVIKRGSWDQFGLTTPKSFIRCLPSTDKHLKKSAGGAVSTEEYFRGKPRLR